MTDPNANNSSVVNDLAQRYREAPRVTRWIIYAVVAALGYFAWEWSFDKARVLNNESDSLQQDINYYNQDEQDIKQIDTRIRLGRAQWGDAKIYETDQGGALSRFVNEVVSNRGVQSNTRQVNAQEVKVSGITDQLSRKIMESSVNARFEAEPHVAVEILAELEAGPLVARLSNLTIRRLNNAARIEVSVEVKTWFYEAAGGSN